MRAELVQLRGRPAMRRPTGTGLAMTAADAAKPREPDRHHAEQRRDLTDPPVLDVTSTATGRTVWPRDGMILGLHGDHRLLHARQNLLCLGQVPSRMWWK